jgi:hypothetical protein
LSFEDIAIRSVILWTIGELGWSLLIALVTTPRPGIGAFLAYAAFKGCVLLGCFGFALLSVEGFAVYTLWAGIIGSLTFLASWWVSLIIRQFLQNVFFRKVGISPKPISWFGEQRSRKRRPRKPHI